MKAVVLRSFGGSEQLALEDVPEPNLLSDEIVIKVEAVSINRSFDLAVRKGMYSRGAVLPLVLGADPSGAVCAVGENVRAFKVGDRVTIMSTIACGRCDECRRGALIRSSSFAIRHFPLYALMPAARMFIASARSRQLRT